MTPTHTTEPLDEAGQITWHSSGPDEGPDVGVSLALGNGHHLYCGEIPKRTFDDTGSKAHFDDDGGWFFVWYKPEPVIIARVGDQYVARDFLEQIAAALRTQKPTVDEEEKSLIFGAAYDAAIDDVLKEVGALRLSKPKPRRPASLQSSAKKEG